MKAFETPDLEIIRFGQESIVATSPCWCNACRVCPDGKNDCECYDFAGKYDPTNES